MYRHPVYLAVFRNSQPVKAAVGTRSSIAWCGLIGCRRQWFRIRSMSAQREGPDLFAFDGGRCRMHDDLGQDVAAVVADPAAVMCANATRTTFARKALP